MRQLALAASLLVVLAACSNADKRSAAPERAPKTVLAVVEGVVVRGWSLDGTLCIEARSEGSDGAAGCGFRVVPTSPGYVPNRVDIQGGRQLVFGALPSSTASISFSIGGIEYSPAVQAKPPFSGKFFTQVAGAVGTPAEIHLKDAANREIEV
jgi:hypothetical protein